MEIKESFKSYLAKLIKSTNDIVEMSSFIEVDEENYDISYSKNPLDLLTCLISGAYNDYLMFKNKIVEKDKLDKRAKNYLKYYRKNDELVRIDSYINGKLSVNYCLLRIKDTSYLIPFLPQSKTHHPAIGTFVAIKNNDFITESFYVTKNSINYFEYKKTSYDITDFLYLSYVPEGNYPVLEYFKGQIKYSDDITCNIDEYYNWTNSQKNEKS